MDYQLRATSRNPALVVYLLDLSVSMGSLLKGRRRIDVVRDALQATMRQMIFRSTRGTRVFPRYRVALYAYSDHVYDALDGVRPIDELADLELPDLEPQHATDTARGFAMVERLLQQELPGLADCPAPVVCHMTDGEFNGADPEPIVRRIMAMRVPDGNVLVENIFISDELLPTPLTDVRRWDGILPDTALVDGYGLKLRAMSSPLPASYRLQLLENHYSMAPGALMLLPGTSPDLVGLGLQMSASTPI